MIGTEYSAEMSHRGIEHLIGKTLIWYKTFQYSRVVLFPRSFSCNKPEILITKFSLFLCVHYRPRSEHLIRDKKAFNYMSMVGIGHQHLLCS